MLSNKYEYLFAVYFTDHKTNEPQAITTYQQKIAEAILNKQHKRIVITASTRAGKSYIVALISILFAIQNPNSKIYIIAPTYDQSKIIMNYIAEHLADTPYVSEQIDLDRSISLESIRKEVSKRKITFKNKSTIEIKSAEGRGERLWGFGGDLIIVDESELISDEVFDLKIMRMLGDNPQSILVEIGNPVNKNHFYKHFQNPEFYSLKISWQACVNEGRLTQQFIDEQRANLSDIEFKILYDAEFAEDEQDALFKYSFVQNAREKVFDGEFEYVLGVDIARFGVDKSVATVLKKFTKIGGYQVVDIIDWSNENTMLSTGRIIDIIERYKPKRINIDETGLGGGVVDRLKEQGFQVQGIQAGASAKEAGRFLNIKAEMYWHLRDLLEKGLLGFGGDKTLNLGVLVSQMLKFKFKFGSNGKIQIEDNQTKSPDFADSLALACYEGKIEDEFYQCVQGIY